jgi:hypothetical protein
LRDVDEIADSPPGAVQDAVTRKIKEEIKEIATTGTTPPVASTPPPASTPAPPTVKDVSTKEAKTEVAKPATKEIIV